MSIINTGKWDDVPALTGSASPKLELGGHYLQILKAKVMEGTSKKTGDPYQLMKIFFDTATIDSQPRFFKRKWEYTKLFNPDAKWPNAGTGVVFIPFPQETNKRTIGRWKGFIKQLEKSNSSQGQEFKWDYDTESLVGKFIGGVFRDEEWVNPEGEIITMQKLAWFCSIEAAAEAEIPRPKLVSDDNSSSASAASAEDAENSPDDADLSGLPFDL